MSESDNFTTIHFNTPIDILTKDRQKCVCCAYSSWKVHGSYNVALPPTSEAPRRNGGGPGCGEAMHQ